MYSSSPSQVQNMASQLSDLRGNIITYTLNLNNYYCVIIKLAYNLDGI